jgi:hypothetical protein
MFDVISDCVEVPLKKSIKVIQSFDVDCFGLFEPQMDLFDGKIKGLSNWPIFYHSVRLFNIFHKGLKHNFISEGFLEKNFVI